MTAAASPGGCLRQPDRHGFAYDAFGAIVAKWTSDGTTSLYKFGINDHWLSNLVTKLFDHQTVVQNVEYRYELGRKYRQES